MMANAAFGIMTILKTVYLALLRQGNIEFSRFKYFLLPPYSTGKHVPATYHKYRWQRKILCQNSRKISMYCTTLIGFPGGNVLDFRV